MLAAGLFVTGFAVTFTLMGAAASELGALILRNRLVLGRVAGAFVIAMGLATTGLLRVPFLYRERRFDLARIRPGPAGALPLGMAFAIGWTPCIGPALAGILTAAATIDGAWRGAALLFVYSLGLGVPFIITGLRQAFLRAWIAVVGAEMIAASEWGLGWVIYDSKEFLNVDVMLASVAVIGLIGFAFERLVFGSLERATVQRWGMVRAAKA